MIGNLACCSGIASKPCPLLAQRQGRNTELHSSDFEDGRLKSTDTIPVLFYAEWCPFCRIFYPEFDKALKGKRVQWAKVDISDDDNPLWEMFGISIVPTVVVFKDGQPVFRRDGVQGRGLPKTAIDETLQEIETNATH